jgi:putative tryptophan/tyrosine transport system substrate-binding protein
MTVHIGRRKFLVAVSGAAAAWPARAWSQGAAKERQRIGWLSESQTKVVKSFADYFLDGMRGFGYVDGRDFDFVPRYAEGFPDRLPRLAQEIIALKPAVIVAAAVNAAIAARDATKATPIVCAALADAVNLGLIVSEARAAAMSRGSSPMSPDCPPSKCRSSARSRQERGASVSSPASTIRKLLRSDRSCEMRPRRSN